MSKSNRIQLSDHFTTGRLLKFTASPIIMMIFTSIYTIVDGFFVSNCAGKTAFTALNLIYPYIQMLGCLGFMIGTGGSALVAKEMGCGHTERANRIFTMMIGFVVVTGLILTALGITNMWWGVFADVGVMVLAVLNATRMLNVKEYR